MRRALRSWIKWYFYQLFDVCLLSAFSSTLLLLFTLKPKCNEWISSSHRFPSFPNEEWWLSVCIPFQLVWHSFLFSCTFFFFLSVSLIKCVKLGTGFSSPYEAQHTCFEYKESVRTLLLFSLGSAWCLYDHSSLGSAVWWGNYFLGNRCRWKGAQEVWLVSDLYSCQSKIAQSRK